MRLNWRRGLATFLMVLSLFQLLPATLIAAVAEGGEVYYGTTGTQVIYHFVKFQNYDGELLTTQLVERGTSAVQPETPMRATKFDDGEITWKFVGWESSPAGVDINSVVVDTQDGSVTFTAVYRAVEKVTVRVDYELGVGEPDVDLPPPTLRYYDKDETHHVYIEAPAVLGYRADPEEIDYTEQLSADKDHVVTYYKEADVDYTIRHWIEKDGAPAYDPANPGATPNAFVEYTENPNPDDSGTVEYGTIIGLNYKQIEGYTPINQVIAPLYSKTNNFNVYYSKNTYTLMFNSNGEGASAPESIVAKYNDPINLPSPTRAGYTFAGWYSDKNLTQQFSSARMPAKTLTVYANWTPKVTSYKIVHWLEVANFDGTPTPGNPEHYAFYAETSGTGTTGTNAVIKESDKQIIRTVAAAQPYALYQYSDTPVIKGDGTTILNVYYYRKLFTITLEARLTTSPYTVGQFDRGTPQASQTRTFYAKYDQSIIEYWPDVGNPTTLTSGVLYSVKSWHPNNLIGTSGAATKRDKLSADLMPQAGRDLIYYDVQEWYTAAHKYNWNVNYHFQQLPERNENVSPYTTTTLTSGIVYVKDGAGSYSQAYFSSSYSDPSLNPKGIDGYTHASTTTTPTKNNSTDPGIRNFYYTRNTYSILFNRMSTDAGAMAISLSNKTGVMFGDRLNRPAMNGYTANLPANWVAASFDPVTGTVLDATGATKFNDNSGVENVFVGWYLDATYQIPLQDHHKMGLGNVTLYARWGTRKITVSVGNSSDPYYAQHVINAGSTLGEANFPADAPEIEGYAFSGWYNGNTKVNAQTKFSDNVTLLPKYEPMPTSYVVRYVYVESGTTTSIRPNKIVSGVRVGDVISVPGTESAPLIPSYMLESQSIPDGSSITMSFDESKNEIIFTYDRFKGYYYQVHYYRTGTTEPVFPSTEVTHTWYEQELLYAFKEERNRNYPALDFQRATMNANKMTEVIFYYDYYTLVDYRETTYLVNSADEAAAIVAWERANVVDDKEPLDPTAVSLPSAVGTVSIGQMYNALDTSTSYTDASGNLYRYRESYPGTRNSFTPTADDFFFAIRRFFQRVQSVAFNMGGSGSGSLNGQVSWEVDYNTPWSAITVPTPEPAANSYFDSWDASFPAGTDAITSNLVFTARFMPKTDLVIKSNSFEDTYDGTEKAASGFVITIGGSEVTNIEARNITTSNPKSTNATPTALVNEIGNRNNLVLWDTTLNKDVTERYNVSYLEGTLNVKQRPITVSAVTESKDYTGDYFAGDYSPKTTDLGHTVTATVAGGGVVPDNYTLELSGVQIMNGGSNVTTNYAITEQDGMLTINWRQPGDEIPLTIKPADTQENYTGGEITVVTNIALAGGSTLQSGLTLSGLGNGKGLVPGDYAIIAINEGEMDGITVLYNGTVDVTANYTFTKQPGKLTINSLTGDHRIPISVRAGNDRAEYTGSELTGTSTSGSIEGTNTFKVPTSSIVTLDASAKGVVEGIYDMVFDATSVAITYEGVNLASNYVITPMPGKFTITTRKVGIPLGVTPKPVVETYTGYEVTGTTTEFTLSSPLPANHRLDMSASGTGVEPRNDYQTTIDSLHIYYIDPVSGKESEVTDNYAVQPNNGQMSIVMGDLIKIQITADDESYEYNGLEQVANVGGTVTSTTQLPSNAVLTVVATGKGTAPKTFPIVIDSITITLNGVDVTAYYDIDEVNGTLTIYDIADPNMRIPMTVQVKGGLLEYNGVWQTLNTEETDLSAVSNVTLPDGTTIQILGQGQGIVPGIDYPVGLTDLVMMLDGVAIHQNYRIEPLDGTLNITNRTALFSLEITPNPVTEIYTGYEVTGTTTEYTLVGTLPENHRLDMSASGTGVEPRTDYQTTIDSLKIVYVDPVSGAETDVTGNYDVLRNNGQMSIVMGAQIAIQITADDASFEYNGLEQVANVSGTVTSATQLPGNAILTVVATGKGTAPKDFPIVIQSITITLNGVDVTDYYNIDEVDGTLTIYNITDPARFIPITVQVKGGELEYTGAWQTLNTEETDLSAVTETLPDGTTILIKGTGDGIVPTVNYPVEMTEMTMMLDGVAIHQNYDINDVDGILTITQRTTGIPLTVRPLDEERDYTGYLQTVTPVSSDRSLVLVDGNLPSDASITVSGEGSGTVPNPITPYKISVTSTEIIQEGVDVTLNYAIDEQQSDLTINALNHGIDVKVKAPDASVPYTGQWQTVPAQSTDKAVVLPDGVNALPTDASITVNSQGRGLATGVAYEMNIITDGVTIMLEGVDVTENYNILPQVGTLTITVLPEGQKLAMEVQVGSEERDYAARLIQVGPVVTDPAEAIISGTLPDDGTISVEGYGEGRGITVPPLDPYPINLIENGVIITADGVDVTENYAITSQPGVLTINAGDGIPIVLQVDSVTRFYTGQLIEVEVNTYTVNTDDDTEELPEGGRAEFTAYGSGVATTSADAANYIRYPITVSQEDVKIFDSEDNDVTGAYYIIIWDGKLNIETRGEASQALLDMTVQAADHNTLVYDGEAHTVNTTAENADAWKSGEPIPYLGTLTVTGEGTGIAPSPMTYDIVVDGVTITADGVDVTENYDLTKNPGTLTIQNRDDAGETKLNMTVIVADAERSYTGEWIDVVTENEGEGAIDVGTLPQGATIKVTGEGRGIATGKAYTIDGKSVALIVDTIDVASKNYTISYIPGTLTIVSLDEGGVDGNESKLEIIVQPAHGSAYYTGQWITVDTVETDPGRAAPFGGLPEDSSATIAVYGTGRGVAPKVYPLTLDISHADGNGVGVKITVDGMDVTENYAITDREAILRIWPIDSTIDPDDMGLDEDEPTPGGLKPDEIDMYVQAGNDETYYTGRTQTTNLSNGFVRNDSPKQLADLDAVDSITITGYGEGRTPGDYDIEVETVVLMQDDVDVSGNYNFGYYDGVFTIKPLTEAEQNQIPLTVRAADDAQYYTGELLTANTTNTALHASSPNPLPDDGTIEITGVGQGIIPGAYPIVIAEDGVTITQDGKDVTSNFAIEKLDGTFTINWREPGNPDPDVGPMALNVKANDDSKEFTGNLVTTTVGATVTGPSGQLPNNGLRITGEAKGEGIHVGNYETKFPTPQHGIKVLFTGEGPQGPVTDFDVTANYDITPAVGTLTITPPANKIPITVAAEIGPAPQFTYNGQQQGYASFNGLVTPADSSRTVPQGSTITVNKSLYGTNAGTYNLNFTATDVKITVVIEGTPTDITSYFQISTVPGSMQIAKKKLNGTIVIDPTDKPGYEYGETIDQPDHRYDGNDLVPGETLDYDVYREPLDQGIGENDIGNHHFTAEIGNNPNYDTTDVIIIDSQFRIGPTGLVVAPDPIEIALDSDGNIVFDLSANGLQFGDSLDGLGLGSGDLHFEYTLDENTQIGDLVPVKIVGAPDAAGNYSVTYGDGYIKVYGQAIFNSNFRYGDNTSVRDGYYPSQSDVVTTYDASYFGMDRLGQRFEGWYLDAACTIPYEPSAIGPKNLNLYAKWTQLYPMIVRHETAEGFTVAPTTTVWLAPGEEYQFVPIDSQIYTAVSVTYTVNGNEIVDAPDSKLASMPSHEVIAVILYNGPAGELAPLPELEAEDPSYLLYGYDIPLSGIFSGNLGYCPE